MSDVVLGSNSGILLGNRVQVVVEGSTGARSMVSNAGTGTVSTTHTDVILQNNIWSRGNVFLAARTSVAGSVTTAGTVTRQSDVNIGGPILEHQSLTAVNTSFTVTFPSSSTNVQVQSGQTRTLAPGAYASVSVAPNATLTLASGTYYFDQLSNEPSGRIVLTGAGPFSLYVRTSFMAKGPIALPAASPAPALLVGVAGANDVFLQTQFDGTLVAPNANVTLAAIGTATYHGAFFGKGLTLQADVKVQHRAAVIPPALAGVRPTLKCVARLSSTTMGAVFGYTNTTGANVKVGAGPNNRFSPGDEDRGQPILFVPGQVPIATFQTFAAGSQLSYKVGSQTVTASGTSPACSAALTGTLTQLFVDNAITNAVRTQLVSIISDPRFANWINTAKASFGPRLTPFQSSVLDAGLLVAANADLLGDPAALTPAQRVRGTAFRAALFANPAITELRLHGDAMRAGTGATCRAIAGLNENQPMQPVLPMRPQLGSLFERMSNFNTLSSVVASKATVAATATGAQAEALMAVPGLTLAGFESLSSLKDLELSGALPTGLLSVIGGVVGGAIIGGVIGGTYGGFWGAVGGAVAGGIIGGVACGLGWDLCDRIFGDTCQPCTGGASDTVQCPTPQPMPGEPPPPPSICVDGCCSSGSVPTVTISFLTGVQCPNAVTRCERDFDCGTGNVCVQNCCVNKQAFTGQCTGTPFSCSAAEDCDAGNNCIYGCCVGRCGFNIQTCSAVDPPNQCGAEPLSCAPGETCSANGCCGIVIP